MASISIEKAAELKCPSCQRTASLQHYPSNFPPKNFSLIHILENSVFAKLEAEPELCFECKTSEAKKLCGACMASVHMPRMFSTHSIVEANAKKFSAPTCSLHGGKKMKLFCNSCSELVCSLCSSHGLHKGHECKIAALKRRSIEVAILPFQEGIMKLKEKGESLRTSEDKMLIKNAEMIEELKSDLSMSWITAAIEKRVGILVEELRTAAESRVQMLGEHRVQTATCLAEANAVLHESRLALEADDFRFLSAFQGIQTRLKDSLARSDSAISAEVPTTSLTCNLGTERSAASVLRATIQNLVTEPTFLSNLYVSGPLELDADREHAFGSVHILNGGVLGVKGGSSLCLRVEERLRIDPGGSIDLSGKSSLTRPAKASAHIFDPKQQGRANGKAVHKPAFVGKAGSVLESVIGGGEGGFLVHPGQPPPSRAAERAGQASPREINAPGAAGAPQGSCGGKGAVAPNLQAQMRNQQSLTQHWHYGLSSYPGFFICGGDGGGGGGALMVRTGILDNRGAILCDGCNGGAGASEAESTAYSWTQKAAQMAQHYASCQRLAPVILFAGGGGGGGGFISISAGQVVSQGVISAVGGAGASASLLGKVHTSWNGNTLTVGGFSPAAVDKAAALADALRAGLGLQLELAPAGDGEAGVVRVTVSETPVAGATPEDSDL